MWIIISAVLCVAISVYILLPPSFGKTRPFIDDKGHVIDKSISEKIHVDIKGISFGMFIMAKDDSNPVLLFLGGGPGIPEYYLEQNYPTGLENEFVVCYMEYRGTSLSYNPDILTETMTTEQYISDVVGITNYLRNRFNQNKIYLMGHSFGTYIGIQTASQNPALYHAYITIAQITNQVESEKIAYNYMLQPVEEAGLRGGINRVLSIFKPEKRVSET